ncbi:MAG: hypothetical protein HYZ42_03890, partial [Bacteroidetes bacterium]|nr:hypothetical protein [Bacteroidota bacterium]
MIKRILTLPQHFILLLILIGFSQHVKAQCSGETLKVAKDSIGSGNVKYTYYVDKDSSCLPYKLKLKVNGAASGMVFKYYVGNASGITSSQDTFSTILTTSGYYNIKVELINGSGTVVCTLLRDSMVRAGVGQNPKISVTPSVLCNGADTVTFIDSTPGIVSRIWIIEGVTYNNNSKIIKHKFKSTGFKSYEVLLISQGDSCQLYRKVDSAVAIYNSSTVDFSAAATTGCKAFNASFSPSVTTNGNTISTYDWTFTGGSPSSYTGQTPGTITYSSAGSYDVSLQVQTTVGCTYSATKTKYINVGDTFLLNVSVDDSVL